MPVQTLKKRMEITIKDHLKNHNAWQKLLFVLKSPYGDFKQMNEIKVGDIVYLKSGSPKLTVDKVNGSDITVVWFASEFDFKFTLINSLVLTKEVKLIERTANL